ncbi:unnamed protein product [Sphacelaria rigidula]
MSGEPLVLRPDLKMEIDGIECEIDPDDTIDDVLKCAGDGDDQQGAAFFTVFPEQEEDLGASRLKTNATSPPAACGALPGPVLGADPFWSAVRTRCSSVVL